MKDLEEAGVCLRIEIREDSLEHELTIPRKRYTLKLFLRLEMTNCTPVEAYMKRVPGKYDVKEERRDSESYRQAIRSLMYSVIGTRFCFAFAVGKLLQFTEKPTNILWVAFKAISWYVE